MNSLRALLITDRGVDPHLSPGFRQRVHSVRDWIEELGFDVAMMHLTENPNASIPVRIVATIRSGRNLRRLASCFDLVVIEALNAPHMVWLASRMRWHGAVLTDLCDSTGLWSEAVTWREEPFFKLKLRAIDSILKSADGQLLLSYATKRDATADVDAHPHHVAIVVANADPANFSGIDPYVGPPNRIVIPADLSAIQNRQAFKWFTDAVAAGTLTLQIPVEIYGPAEPPDSLPQGVLYKGWAPRLEDIYSGQTAVFAPTVKAAGIQNKYLEAVAAGRPVVIGTQPASSLPAYGGALTYSTAEELVHQLDRLQHFATPLVAGSTQMSTIGENAHAKTVVRELAKRRHQQG